MSSLPSPAETAEHTHRSLDFVRGKEASVHSKNLALSFPLLCLDVCVCDVFVYLPFSPVCLFLQVPTVHTRNRSTSLLACLEFEHQLFVSRSKCKRSCILVFIKDAGRQSIQKGDGGQGANGWSLPAGLELRWLTATAAAAAAACSQLILQELLVSIIAAKQIYKISVTKACMYSFNTS